MALSRELRKRLNSEDEPLTKRLKLAENVFHSPDLPIVRKEDIILQWICDLPTKRNIWKTLKRCVESEYFNVKPDIKERLIDNCTEELSKKVQNVPGEILECCNLLLSNSGMQQYFIDVPEKLATLVKSILQCIDCFVEQHSCCNNADESISTNKLNGEDISMTLIYNIAVSTIENMVHILQYSSSTKLELRKVFVRNILYPLCKITRHTWDDDTNTLDVAAYKCIQRFIFGKPKYGQYKSSDVDVIPDIFPELCHVLSECAKENNLESNLLMFKLVFRTAIGFYKSDPVLLDYIFREVLDAAGQCKMQVLKSFFHYLKDIPFNLDNKIKDITLHQYLHKILDDVLSNEHLTAIDYEILSGIAHFNPLVIVSKVPQILVKVYLEQEVSENANSMNAILDANMKLRSEEKLISQLLIALKETLSIKKKSNAKIQQFFPIDFLNQLTNAISKITHSQVLNILNSLVNLLNDDCMELLSSDNMCKNIIMIRATAELLTALFNGVRFFEPKGTLTSHTMFANNLNELGKVLSLLIDKALQLSYNESLITVLLSVIIKLCETERTLKFYVPKVITDEFLLPISDDQCEQLIKKITDFGGQDSKDNMNKLMLYRIKDKQDSEFPFKLKSLIGGMNCAWSNILKDNIELVSLLNRKEISKLIQLVLTEMVSNQSNFDHWLKEFKSETLEENRTFVATLITNVLVQIGLSLVDSITAKLTKHINNKDMVEAMETKSENLINSLNLIKEDIVKSEWCSMEQSVSERVVPYLKILLSLPTKFLDTNVRTLLFLVIYSVNKECNGNEEVCVLCDEILLDLFEKSAIDIHQLGPKMLSCTSRQSKAIPKALEQSLKYISSYAVLKEWIKFSQQKKDSMFLLLECIANVKPKVDSSKKLIFDKAERKLFKTILKMLGMEVTSPKEVRNLTLLLRISLSHEKRNDELKELANKTLCDIFLAGDNSLEKNSKELIGEGLELVLVMLKNPKEFPLSSITTKQIWLTMLKSPHQNLLPHLLCMTGPEEFQELLKLLHHQIIRDLSENNEVSMENNVLIWNAMMKCDMSAKRKQLRSAAIDNLLQIVQLSQISEILWPIVLKFLNVILASKHLHISDRVLDTIIFISLRSLAEVKMTVCNETLMLCALLVNNRPNLITDRLPALLLLYRRIIKEIVNTSRNASDKHTEHHCKCLALDFEKLTGSLAKLRKDMARLSPYLISDIINLISESPVPPFIKDSIENCISHLISICDQHALALLFRALPVSMQELFKMYLGRFNKFHKFSGKI